MATADPPAPTPPTHATPRPAAPLWDGYCADPFVLREDGGRYVMYGTTPVPLPGGRAFQVLVSDDLESWQDVGGALEVGQDDPGGHRVLGARGRVGRRPVLDVLLRGHR